MCTAHYHCDKNVSAFVCVRMLFTIFLCLPLRVCILLYVHIMSTPACYISFPPSRIYTGALLVEKLCRTVLHSQEQGRDRRHYAQLTKAALPSGAEVKILMLFSEPWVKILLADRHNSLRIPLYCKKHIYLSSYRIQQTEVLECFW